MTVTQTQGKKPVFTSNYFSHLTTLQIQVVLDLRRIPLELINVSQHSEKAVFIQLYYLITEWRLEGN